MKFQVPSWFHNCLGGWNKVISGGNYRREARD